MDPRTFDPFRDLDRATGVARVLDAFDPDRGAPFARGSRLLLHRGEADPQAPPRNAFTHCRYVIGASGRRAASEGMRVFVVPGV